jgi:YbbR domain-containing protein
LNGIQAAVVVDLNGVSAPGFTKPFGVRIVDASKKDITTNTTVTPPQVSVKMVITADAITVPKAVGWTLTGQPAAGYRVTNVTIAPLQVNATGIQNTLSNIGFLSTDPVDIGNQKGDVVKIVTIRPPPGVEVSQRTATVHVFISQVPGVSPSASPSAP